MYLADDTVVCRFTQSRLQRRDQRAVAAYVRAPATVSVSATSPHSASCTHSYWSRSATEFFLKDAEMQFSYPSGARSSVPVLSRSSMGGRRSGGRALRKGEGTGWLDEASAAGGVYTEASRMTRRESIAVGALCSSSESVTTQVPGSAMGRSR